LAQQEVIIVDGKYINTTGKQNRKKYHLDNNDNVVNLKLQNCAACATSLTSNPPMILNPGVGFEADPKTSKLIVLCLFPKFHLS
jgi:hypothetical protein